MNTAKLTAQSGSESSNPMIANAKQQEQYKRINTVRKSLAGPSYDVIFTDILLGITVFGKSTESGKTYMMGFSGRRTKPDFNYSFRTPGQANIFLDAWHKKLITTAEFKETRKSETAMKKTQQQTALAVGDILVASWGYEQTNVDYYQVTRLVGRYFVEIRELCQLSEETTRLQGDCVPLKDKFKGEPKVKRVNETGSVKVESWGVYARKKESIKIGSEEIFTPDHYTAYA